MSDDLSDDNDLFHAHRPIGVWLILKRVCLCGKTWTYVANRLNTDLVWTVFIARRSAALAVLCCLTNPPVCLVLIVRTWATRNRDQAFWNIMQDVLLASSHAGRLLIGKFILYLLVVSCPLLAPLLLPGFVTDVSPLVPFAMVVLVAVARLVTTRWISIFDILLALLLWYRPYV